MAVQGFDPIPEITIDQPEEDGSSETKDSSPYPNHPISQLQGPFHESIREATDKSADEWVVDIDAQTRRRDLLENDEYERLCGRKWRQRASEKYHPFWKLVSQMVFGVHLLANGMAKSDQEVMKILQSHVDELDGFLQRSTEDFLIIHLDVRTRIQYLSLPLGNLDVFDEMLNDRNFRLALVAYNDQIVHSIDRFTLAITDSIKDLRKGKEAMGALWHYLLQLSDGGCFQSDHLTAFYKAMMENMEGWIIAMSKLRRRGASLQKALGQLSFAVTEMQRRVGVASRKDLRSFIKATNSGINRNKSVRQMLFAKGPTTSGPSSNKPLPRDPLQKPKSRPTTSRKAPTPAPEKPTEEKLTKRASILPRSISRAKSCSALAAEANANIKKDDPPPPIPGRLSRKLSKPFLPKRSASERLEITLERPSTAPARTLKSRSASIEQLKALWTNTRPKTPQGISKSPTRPPPPLPHSQGQGQQGQSQQPGPSQGTLEPETMKDQLSQFLKTDRVLEAWENITQKANCCGTSLSKDWPSSIFRTKSSELRSSNNKQDKHITPEEIEQQMSWIPEPVFLNTYSFKQRPDVSPRIHVLSVQMALNEDPDLDISGLSSSLPSTSTSATRSIMDDSEMIDSSTTTTVSTLKDCENLESEIGDAESIITALPVVPSTSSSIPSLATEYQPRPVECA